MEKVPATPPDLDIALPLRDACIHGRYEPHNTDQRHIDSFRRCPGGQDITIDPLVEAARLLIGSIDEDDWGWSETGPLRYELTQFDIAIGGTE